jgi:hypothetical protein
LSWSAESSCTSLPFSSTSPFSSTQPTLLGKAPLSSGSSTVSVPPWCSRLSSRQVPHLPPSALGRPRPPAGLQGDGGLLVYGPAILEPSERKDISLKLDEKDPIQRLAPPPPPPRPLPTPSPPPPRPLPAPSPLSPRP